MLQGKRVSFLFLYNFYGNCNFLSISMGFFEIKGKVGFTFFSVWGFLLLYHI